MRKELRAENEGFTLCASARHLLRLILELSAHRRQCAMELEVLREGRSTGTAAAVQFAETGCEAFVAAVFRPPSVLAARQLAH